MRKGTVSGVFFCAEVETADNQIRTFLRFVAATPGWAPVRAQGAIISEIGSCLRLIDCTEDTPRHVPELLSNNVFDFWEVAQADIIAEWDRLSDPANLQPRIRPLNRRVADYIRSHPPQDLPNATITRALDILESPWTQRDERNLRQKFETLAGKPAERSLDVINWILATGLEPSAPPEPLPDLSPEEDIRLICWMAVYSI